MNILNITSTLDHDDILLGASKIFDAYQCVLSTQFHLQEMAQLWYDYQSLFKYFLVIIALEPRG